MAFNIFRKKKRQDRESESGQGEALSPQQDTVEKPPEQTVVEVAAPESPPQPAPDVSHAAEEKPEDQLPPSSGFYGRLRNGLAKTRRLLTTDIDELFSGGKQLTPDDLDEIEERLITADIGVKTAMEIMERLSRVKISDSNHLKKNLKEILHSYLRPEEDGPIEDAVTAGSPRVILVVGVNGVGKTTTIGKLAARYIRDGKRVMLVAGDTFRAAAIEQLEIWAKRTGADFIKHRENADPSAVVYDGLEAAGARGTDIVLIDTAGRLHTKVNLMEELKKIKRTITKKIADAPHEVLLVLDATTGQNALSQAELFLQATDVSGIALTKLDGTAKGGIVVNLCHSFRIPLRYIGVGEQVDDLQPFDPEKFIEALF